MLVAAECWWLSWERAHLWVVAGAAWEEKCDVPARRSHFRCEFSPVAEGAPSSC